MDGHSNGFGSAAAAAVAEYIRRHHLHEIGENQCSSTLVKHIKAPVPLVTFFFFFLFRSIWEISLCFFSFCERHRSKVFFLFFFCDNFACLLSEIVFQCLTFFSSTRINLDLWWFSLVETFECFDWIRYIWFCRFMFNKKHFAYFLN